MGLAFIVQRLSIPRVVNARQLQLPLAIVTWQHSQHFSRWVFCRVSESCEYVFVLLACQLLNYSHTKMVVSVRRCAFFCERFFPDWHFEGGWIWFLLLLSAMLLLLLFVWWFLANGLSHLKYQAYVQRGVSVRLSVCLSSGCVCVWVCVCT